MQSKLTEYSDYMDFVTGEGVNVFSFFNFHPLWWQLLRFLSPMLLFLFSPLGHPRFQVFPLMRSHSSRCSSLIPKITLLDKDDFGET